MEKYLDRLQNERNVVVKSLEKLRKRAVALVHQRKQWYDWVKEAQEEEEKRSESESKKVKLEAHLFRRHQQEIARRQRDMKAKEDKKRDEDYLNQVYTRRLSEMSEEEQDEWDPIQDVYGYEKDNYIDLIKFFLTLEDNENSEKIDGMPVLVEPTKAPSTTRGNKVLSRSARKRVRKANAKAKKPEDPDPQAAECQGRHIIGMESRKQMRERLRIPVKFERESGIYFKGRGMLGLGATTPVPSDDEIEQLLNEIAEIKNFLFCRLLLSQATLLPVALETDSIEEFLQRKEVTREHLRDLCLKLERPRLQDVRDACADLIRERDGVEEEETSDTVNQANVGEREHTRKKYKPKTRPQN